MLEFFCFCYQDAMQGVRKGSWALTPKPRTWRFGVSLPCEVYVLHTVVARRFASDMDIAATGTSVPTSKDD